MSGTSIICLASLARAVVSLARTVYSSFCLPSLALAVPSLARTVFSCRERWPFCALQPFSASLGSSSPYLWRRRRVFERPKTKVVLSTVV